jgi:hypothetical protein
MTPVRADGAFRAMSSRGKMFREDYTSPIFQAGRISIRIPERAGFSPHARNSWRRIHSTGRQPHAE